MTFSYTEPISINVVGAIPEKGRVGDAAFDLRAAEDFKIEGLHRLLVRTNTRIQLPEGTVGLVCSRSGLANNKGICVLNAPGVVDPNFTGPIGVILYNSAYADYRGQAGERIAQLLIIPVFDKVNFIQKESLEETNRGENGYGSSGNL